MSFVLVALVFVTNACGSASMSSSVTSESEAGDSRPLNSMTPISANLGEIRVKAATAPAVGIWSEVDVEFTLPCSVSGDFEANLSYVRSGERVQILTSGYVFGVKQVATRLVCQTFSIATKTIVVPGIVSVDDVEIVDLAKDTIDLGANFIGYNTLDNIRVAAASPICPAPKHGEMTCMAIGSRIDLEIDLSTNGCLNKLAAVTSEVISQEGDKILVAVHAVEAVHESGPVVLCGPMQPVKTSIHVPQNVESAADVELVIIR